MTTMTVRQAGRPSSVDLMNDKTKPHRCATCGEVAHLTVRDPLPDGWLVEVSGYHRQKVTYWCGRECREEAG